MYVNSLHVKLEAKGEELDKLFIYHSIILYLAMYVFTVCPGLSLYRLYAVSFTPLFCFVFIIHCPMNMNTIAIHSLALH